MKSLKSLNINTPTYWDGVYLKDPEFGLVDQLKYQMLAQQVVDESAVVDLGCGVGDLLSAIDITHKFCELWGVDHSPAAIDKAQKRLMRSRFKVGDVTNTKLDSEYFNYVFSLETIEHLDKPQLLVREMARLTMPDGLAFLTTPYEDHIPSGEHVWQFDLEDMGFLFKPFFSKVWVFPWASGRMVWWDEARTRVKYPKGNLDEIFVIARK